MKLYCLSGLGVDERAFKNIKVDGVELIHIQWIDPLPNETLEQYARRLFETVQPEDNYLLLGLSFGGMIATEFSKIKQPSKLFLVSTIYRRSQLPFFLKLAAALHLHKTLPMGLFRSSNFLTNFFFGVKDDPSKKLLDEILHDTDPAYLRWAVNTIVHWKNTVKPTAIYIHGTNDRILPLKQEIRYKIKNGGHFMIVDHADEISAILKKECS